MSQTINISDLDIAQLSDVRKQLEEVSRSGLAAEKKTEMSALRQELNHLTNSFAQLRQAQAKFKACIENVSEAKAGNKGEFRFSSRILLRLSLTFDLFFRVGVH